MDEQVECYQRAVGCDQYLAIAYFQEGVSNFLLGDFEEALANFNDTLLYLRGNTSIDYDQLGLKFRLFSCEVLFNRGLCYIYLHQSGPGMQDLEFASKEKVTPDHDVINDAIRERAEGYTVFSIPVGVVYRPNEAKVKNLKAKDYLGKAKLIAAADRNNVLTGYGDTKRTTPPVIDQRALEDRSPEQISYGASHLVQKNLSIRTRQQSEPPLNRNVFPPTPPPDADKSSTSTSTNSSTSSSGANLAGRSASVRAARPPRLDLDRPGANVTGQSPSAEKPRIGTMRTASESRGQQAQKPQGLFIQTTGINQSQDQGQGQGQGHGHGQGHRRGVSDTGYAEFSTQPPTRRSLVTSQGSRRMVHPRSQPQQYIDEQDEYGSEDDDSGAGPGTFNDGEFEMVSAGHGHSQGYSKRRPSRQIEINKFRIKVHAAHDTRYIIVAPNVQLGEFEGKIRDKFGFATSLKIKMRDDGDMVTMVDQEDLDLLLLAAKEIARREGSELGKMEVWVEERGAPMI